jgi:hypothetical protein
MVGVQKGGTAMIIDMLLLLAENAEYTAVYRDGEIYVERAKPAADAR